MSAAFVANATMISNAARAYGVRGLGATGYQTIDAIDTDSFATRARDQFRAPDEAEGRDYARPQSRRGSITDRVVGYGGVLVSREVGTAIVQAQASYSKTPPNVYPAEAERNIAIYESNQALMGTPQVTTNVGIMH
ncbi:MAG: hypothetical protein FJX59_17885 [Alphaproteobacteria bacterium]|nr:hypothetical protein [Alphaproteobacteria bacterium]